MDTSFFNVSVEVILRKLQDDIDIDDEDEVLNLLDIITGLIDCKKIDDVKKVINMKFAGYTPLYLYLIWNLKKIDRQTVKNMVKVGANPHEKCKFESNLISFGDIYKEQRIAIYDTPYQFALSQKLDLF